MAHTAENAFQWFFDQHISMGAAMGIMTACATELSSRTSSLLRCRERVPVDRVSLAVVGYFAVTADAELIDWHFKDKEIIAGMRIMTDNTSSAGNYVMDVRQPIVLLHQIFFITVAGDT